MGQSADYIHHLRGQLLLQFKESHWAQLGATLEQVADIGQIEGQKELCLRAQSLRELMGTRSGGVTLASPRVEQLFTDLLFHLSHYQWASQVPYSETLL